MKVEPRIRSTSIRAVLMFLVVNFELELVERGFVVVGRGVFGIDFSS